MPFSSAGRRCKPGFPADLAVYNTAESHEQQQMVTGKVEIECVRDERAKDQQQSGTA